MSRSWHRDPTDGGEGFIRRTLLVDSFSGPGLQYLRRGQADVEELGDASMCTVTFAKRPHFPLLPVRNEIEEASMEAVVMVQFRDTTKADHVKVAQSGEWAPPPAKKPLSGIRNPFNSMKKPVPADYDNLDDELNRYGLRQPSTVVKQNPKQVISARPVFGNAPRRVYQGTDSGSDSGGMSDS
jgi:hypothetical protein